jgi:hypothetical protein
MVKLKTAAPVLPLLLTVAELPAAPVVVVPTAIVAAAPVGPCGRVKLKTTAPELPDAPTAAVEPGAPVMVLPTEIVAAAPVGPVAPSSASKLQFALTPGTPVFPVSVEI